MTSAISFTNASSNVSAQTFHNFEMMTRACHENLVSLATEAGMPKRIDVILAEEFDSVVSEKQREPDAPRLKFSSARPNGCVAGKNLAQDDAWDHVVIVFNSSFWGDTVTIDFSLIFLQLSLIAHELAHPYIGRMRHKSSPTERTPSDPFHRNARNLTRLMIDEYFADIISDIIVRISSRSVSSDGNTSLHVWDIFGENHLNTLRTYLSEGCAEIPTYVADYKADKISYEIMWEKAMSSIFHLFTQYIHARAFADCMPTEILIFDSPEIKSLPFVQKYIPKSLSDFLQQLRNYPAKMSLTEWRDMETKLFPLGEKCFLEIWDRLEAPKPPKTPEVPLFLRLLSYLLKQEGGHA